MKNKKTLDDHAAGSAEAGEARLKAFKDEQRRRSDAVIQFLKQNKGVIPNDQDIRRAQVAVGALPPQGSYRHFGRLTIDGEIEEIIPLPSTPNCGNLWLIPLAVLELNRRADKVIITNVNCFSYPGKTWFNQPGESLEAAVANFNKSFPQFNLIDVFEIA